MTSDREKTVTNQEWPRTLSRFFALGGTVLFSIDKDPSKHLATARVGFSRAVEWDLLPFIGTIGVAPQSEIHASSVAQGPWGGNWGCRHMRKGATLLFNSFNDGGLLYVGNVHGSQGDGELSGIANEIEADLELEVNVLPRRTIPYARIETEDEYICFYSTKPLESAVSTATDFCFDGWLS